MTTDQQNRLAMCAATRALLASAPAVRALPAFAARFATFCALLDELAALETAQADSLPSQIARRESALRDLTRATLAVAGAGLSYADAHAQEGLALKMRLAPRHFVRARLAERPVLAQRIVDALTPLLPQLADHGVTDAVVTDLQTKIDAAAAHVTGSRTTVAAKRAATTRLKEIFSAVHRVLTRQIDPLLRPLQETDPDFYARYRAVRQIVRRPGAQAASPGATDPGETAAIAVVAAPITEPSPLLQTIPAAREVESERPSAEGAMAAAPVLVSLLSG